MAIWILIYIHIQIHDADGDGDAAADDDDADAAAARREGRALETQGSDGLAGAIRLQIRGLHRTHWKIGKKYIKQCTNIYIHMGLYRIIYTLISIYINM